MEDNVHVLPPVANNYLRRQEEARRKRQEAEEVLFPPRVCCVCGVSEKEMKSDVIGVGTANDPHAIICSTTCMLQLLERDDSELDWSPHDHVNYGTKYECEMCGDPRAAQDEFIRDPEYVPGPEHPPAERYLTMAGGYCAPVYDNGIGDGGVTAFCSRACAINFFRLPENQYDAKTKMR